jgi:uncharacterized membrane protein YedE/YeeE
MPLITNPYVGSVVGLGTGAIFGIALEKSKLFAPHLIRSQMLFQDFTMLKTFLMASVTGMVVITSLEVSGVAKRSLKRPLALGFGLLGGYGANVLGGLVLGAGMTIAGACPGTVIAQIAVGVENARWTIAGGLFASFLYGYFDSWITEKTHHKYGKKGDVASVDKFAGGVVKPTIIFSGILTALVAGVEMYRPYMDDFAKSLPVASQGTLASWGLSLSAKMWAPEVAGVVIGLLQLPSMYLIGTTLGTSSSYCSIAGCFACAVDKDVDKHAKYLKGYIGGLNNLWQGGVVAGIFLGASISQRMGHAYDSDILANDISPLTAFIGGGMLLFGARIAGGCTSGHGISGIPQMNIPSLVTVACMFAGGIGTALCLYQ